MKIRTARWNDPKTKHDGTRILVCRFRPRALKKELETWDEWNRDVAPSAELVADFYGKHGAPIGWKEYEKRYRAEMRARKDAIAALAARVESGERLTLLCSKQCTDAERCHRSLLAAMIERALDRSGGRSRARAKKRA